MADLVLSPSRFDPDIGVRVVPELSQKQKELLAFVLLCAALGERRILVLGCIGEWGGGKSMIAFIIFLVLCILNSDPDQTDPDLLPCSGIWARTEDDAKRSTVAELLQVVPPELIRERTDEYILWEFGHKTWIYSARKSAEGASLTHVLADEIQKPEYGPAWPNIKARARADRAKLRVAIAVGLAERGPVEDIFRTPEEDDGQIIFYRMMYPEENPANPPGYANTIRAGQPGSRKRDKRGWLIRTGALYPTFSSERNIHPVRERWPDVDALKQLPIHLGIDQGQWSSAVIAVDVDVLVVDDRGKLKKAKGLLFIDQVVIDNCAEGELAVKTAVRIRERGYTVKSGSSIACFDPTLIPAQLDAWRAAIPGFSQIQTKEGPYKFEKNGIKAVDWAICDGLENTRLFVHPRLNGDSTRGIPESLTRYLEAKLRDKVFEHTADAIRVLVQVKLPLPDPPAPTRVKMTTPAVEIGEQWRI